MTGIYIHIPFCIQRCHYCDFYSTLRLKDRDVFIDNIISEISQRRDFLNNKNVDTIYFGGGTPSLLSANDLERIIKELNNHFILDQNIEICLEANPDDLNAEYLSKIKKIGINRLSIGIQSFLDKDLKLLNRRHNSREAVDAVKLAQEAGFDSISIDLIYGLPEQNIADWKSNLYHALKLSVEHISAYHLTYEKGTNFYKWLKEGKLKEAHDELSLEMFDLALKTLENHGYEQYEISNFARDKKYSRHNTKYWFGEEYLGLGPSAHSYNGRSREWNVSNIDAWINQDKKEHARGEIEFIDQKTRRNELIMTRLRTKWGIPKDEFITLFGKQAWIEILNLSSEYLKSGLLEIKNEALTLTTKGKFLSDGIIADLFLL